MNQAAAQPPGARVDSISALLSSHPALEGEFRLPTSAVLRRPLPKPVGELIAESDGLPVPSAYRRRKHDGLGETQEAAATTADRPGSAVASAPLHSPTPPARPHLQWRSSRATSPAQLDALALPSSQRATPALSRPSSARTPNGASTLAPRTTHASDPLSRPASAQVRPSPLVPKPPPPTFVPSPLKAPVAVLLSDFSRTVLDEELNRKELLSQEQRTVIALLQELESDTRDEVRWEEDVARVRLQLAHHLGVRESQIRKGIVLQWVGEGIPLLASLERLSRWIICTEESGGRYDLAIGQRRRKEQTEMAPPSSNAIPEDNQGGEEDPEQAHVLHDDETDPTAVGSSHKSLGPDEPTDAAVVSLCLRLQAIGRGLLARKNLRILTTNEGRGDCQKNPTETECMEESHHQETMGCTAATSEHQTLTSHEETVPCAAAKSTESQSLNRAEIVCQLQQFVRGRISVEEVATKQEQLLRAELMFRSASIVQAVLRHLVSASALERARLDRFRYSLSVIQRWGRRQCAERKELAKDLLIRVFEGAVTRMRIRAELLRHQSAVRYLQSWGRRQLRRRELVNDTVQQLHRLIRGYQSRQYSGRLYWRTNKSEGKANPGQESEKVDSSDDAPAAPHDTASNTETNELSEIIKALSVARLALLEQDSRNGEAGKAGGGAATVCLSPRLMLVRIAPIPPPSGSDECEEEHSAVVQEASKALDRISLAQQQQRAHDDSSSKQEHCDEGTNSASSRTLENDQYVTDIFCAAAFRLRSRLRGEVALQESQEREIVFRSWLLETAAIAQFFATTLREPSGHAALPNVHPFPAFSLLSVLADDREIPFLSLVSSSSPLVLE